eukprot:SAG22_NODE_924_length_6477_cov_50.153183_3_plen_129_part_00
MCPYEYPPGFVSKDQPLQITFESKQHGKQFPSVRYVICGYAGRCSESALSNDNAAGVWVREFSLATRHTNPDGQIKFFRFRQITAVIGIEAGDWIRACMCEDWPRRGPSCRCSATAPARHPWARLHQQ